MTHALPPDPLRHAAGLWPDLPALEHSAGTVTFAGLDVAVDRVCRVLARHGARPRRPVLSVEADVALHVTILLAVLRLGAIAAPVSHRLPAEGLGELAARLGSPVRVGPAGSAVDADELRAAPAGAEPASPVHPPAGARRRATVFHTSGSAGRPKAVVHRLAAHLRSAEAAAAHLGLGSGDRWLLTLPLNHVGGLAPVFRALRAGATMVVPDGPPTAALLRSTRTTHVSLVATQLRRLVASGKPPPTTLRCVLLGGGPVDPSLLREAFEGGWPVAGSYGMTESASLVAATRPGEPDPLTAGRPLAHARIRIGRDGEILLRGASLAEGYLEDGRVSRLTDRSGWFHTGDRGLLGADGRLTIVGRLDRRFVSGGENVQPEEIERRIAEIPGVHAVVVVPVPDPEYGQRPVAFIDGTIDPEVIRAELRRRLPSFLVPDAFFPMPDAPEGSGLKASPARLREIALRGLGRG
jgi:O-succinylbenzoic acid--CoA ligase